MVATLSPATVTLTLEGPLASAPVIVGRVSNALLADQTYELTAGEDGVVKARRRLLSVHLYVSLAPLPDMRLLLAGLGNGMYCTVGGEDRKASTRMAAARLERDWKMGGFALSGKLGFLSVESEMKAEAADAAALRGGSFQSRVELGAGLRGAWIAGLDADISTRYQLDGAKRSERKLQGNLSIDPDQDRQGLLLDANQEHSLSEGADGSTSVASEYTVRLGHG